MQLIYTEKRELKSAPKAARLMRILYLKFQFNAKLVDTPTRLKMPNCDRFFLLVKLTGYSGKMLPHSHTEFTQETKQ